MINPELLKEYEDKLNELAAFMNEMPQDVLGFKPDIEDAWTIDQHLRHLLTIEIYSFLFVNDVIANHITKEFKNIDNMGDLEELLSTYQEVRSEILRVISQEPFKETRCKIKSSVHGIMEMSFEEGLQALNNHLEVHKGYMGRNIKEYSKGRH